MTAILPHGGNLFQEKVAGAVFVGNAFGKLAGSTQVEELGTIETPDRPDEHAVGRHGRGGGRRSYLEAQGQRVGTIGQRTGR